MKEQRKNLFLKNLDRNLHTEGLEMVLGKFGKVKSCKVSTDLYGFTRGYGYAHFESERIANWAKEQLNGMKQDTNGN